MHVENNPEQKYAICAYLIANDDSIELKHS